MKSNKKQLPDFGGENEQKGSDNPKLKQECGHKALS